MPTLSSGWGFSVTHTHGASVGRREKGSALFQSLRKSLPGSMRQFPLLKNGFNNSPLGPGSEGRLTRSGY